MLTDETSRTEERALTFLVAAQDEEGGWSYAAGQPACVEPTAAVLLALRDEPSMRSHFDRGVQWLRGAQHRDGGWGLSASDPESGWQTAWGVIALQAIGGDEPACARGRNWLLGVESFQSAGDELYAEMKRIASIDLSLRGWPWRRGEASWVEPTALALLVLEGEASSQEATARIQEAVRYLTDRRCAGGGWNFGNPVMLGAALPPRANPTALALLALAQVAPQAIAPADKGALRDDLARDRGALALAWGRLALRVLGDDDPTAAAMLAALQGEDGGWNANPYHTALAILAGKGAL